MTTTGRHDVRERVDGTVTVSVERTGLFSCLVGVLFGVRTGRCLDVEAIGLKRGSNSGKPPDKSEPEALA